MKNLTCVAAMLLLSGCFTYVPYEHTTPRTGDRVTADLTPSGSEDLARLVGPRVGSVRGQVVNADASSLLLSVSSTTNYDEVTTDWKGETVALPLGGVDHILAKKFSVGRTLLMTGVTVGVGILGAKILTGVTNSSNGTNGGGGPNPN
jgi:hypothetical protein